MKEGGQSPQPTTFLQGSSHATCITSKRKKSNVPRCSYPEKFLLTTQLHTCWKMLHKKLLLGRQKVLRVKTNSHRMVFRHIRRIWLWGGVKIITESFETSEFGHPDVLIWITWTLFSGPTPIRLTEGSHWMNLNQVWRRSGSSFLRFDGSQSQTHDLRKRWLLRNLFRLARVFHQPTSLVYWKNKAAEESWIKIKKPGQLF